MDEKEVEIKLQDLDKQYHDLDKRIGDFEFWRRVARVLGLSLGGILIFVFSQYRQIDSFRQQIEEVSKQSGPLAANLSNISARESAIEVEIGTLEGRLADVKREMAMVEKRSTETAMSARLKQFESTQLDRSRSQESYQQQFLQLNDFGLEYMAYLGENPDGDRDGQLYGALAKAAESLKTKGSLAPQVAQGWLNEAQRFQLILTNFRENPRGLSPVDRSLCYEAELPVWLERSGVVTVNSANKMAEKSPRCQCLLGEPDDRKFQSKSECHDFLTGNNK
jgi:hypothetical protein